MAHSDLSPGARRALAQAKEQGADQMSDEEAARIALHLYGPGPLKQPDTRKAAS